MTIVTGLSGNEIFCLSKMGYQPGEFIFGNSTVSRGVFGAISSDIRNIFGGEVVPVTQAIAEGRKQAFNRMTVQARENGASGVAGVASELRETDGRTQFLFVGSGVHSSKGGKGFFSSAGNAQELFCHMDAGYEPLKFAFGNIAYSMGIGGFIKGGLKSFVRGEVKSYSDVFNRTRHIALDRLVADAKEAGANAVVGIQTEIRPWKDTHEMLMTGTAARHNGLPETANAEPVTSDLTGPELWAMQNMGYAPQKLLLSTSVYSLGIVGGLKAALQSLKRGEIKELTDYVHDARDEVVKRLKAESRALNADMVAGVKTYVSEFGDSGLLEIMAIGTAMKQTAGITTKSPALLVQAVVPDRNTWIGGGAGFPLNRAVPEDVETLDLG